MLDEDAIIVEEVGTEDWILRSFSFADGKKTKIGRHVGTLTLLGMGASIGGQVRPAQPTSGLASRRRWISVRPIGLSLGDVAIRRAIITVICNTAVMTSRVTTS